MVECKFQDDKCEYWYMGICELDERLNVCPHDENYKLLLDAQAEACKRVEANKKSKVCNFCFNASVDAKLRRNEDDLYFENELTDKNDFSSSTMGFSSNNCQMYINSGGGKPVEIEFCTWGPDERWHTTGIYYPKFCPECGRRLDEYEIDERGAKFTKKEIDQ